MKKRVLVSQNRVPEIDRDCGSQRVDLYIKWLLEEGWSVTFVAYEECGDHRHVQRLRQQGVATFLGFNEADRIAAAGDFDLALLAFWKPASTLLPVLRATSPLTPVIVDSVDLHFLREARRALVPGLLLDDATGALFAGELNTYRQADAVLTVSEREADLLSAFLGADGIYALPVANEMSRSTVSFGERRGMVFVGNFLHLPNGEAVEYLCRDILPRLDPKLLAEHPLRVLGSRLVDNVRAHARGVRGVEIVGWVPSVLPYLDTARVSAVPLLHGAGTKGKIVESLMKGTPVVTTPVGAEGMDLRHDEHALIAETASGLAAALTQLLTDEREWRRIADAGHELAMARHSPAQVRARFLEIVDETLSTPSSRTATVESGLARLSRHELAYRDATAAAIATLRKVTAPEATVLVVSRGDDRLTALPGREGAHFPQAPDGKWAGHHPANAGEAIAQLEALRARGARYFAIPSPSFWWLHYYEGLTDHLEERYRRIHSGEQVVVFDIGEHATLAHPPRADRGGREHVLVLGRYDPAKGGPPPSLVAELEQSDRYVVSQQWRSRLAPDGPEEPSDAAWIVHVQDTADLPQGFVDRFLDIALHLEQLGVQRFQPAHRDGPAHGPPATERLRGIVAREVAGPAPLPVLAERPETSKEAPVALVDATSIGLLEPISSEVDPQPFSDVTDVFVLDGDEPRRLVRRVQSSAAPLISVLIATYERPELLSACLESFCEQTLPASDFELVVVDDGSRGADTVTALETFAGQLPLTWVRMEHGARSAAKNLATLLARAELVLFFDDDDLAAPDLLEQHVGAHAAHPDEATAILGHTEWAPDLRVTPLMHYLTDVDKMLFAYGNLAPGRRLDWHYFWEGRISSKRSFHRRYGLHDQRLAYSVDVEMAWRLARHGLGVVYWPSARSFMARPVDFEQFCARREAKGVAEAMMAALHPDPEVIAYTRFEGAAARWRAAQPGLELLVTRVRQLEVALERDVHEDDERESLLSELHRLYRAAFMAYTDRGIAGAGQSAAQERPVMAMTDPARVSTVRPGIRARSPAKAGANGGEPPELTVTMPVWSRTPELADMAVRTIERVWEVARLRIEVVVVDNGSPVSRPLRARVHRFEENTGVASGWNTGIELARAPVIAVLNSDCLVEPGWDEALYEAATTGRRIAFPYTDHRDGRGFRMPDQAGTAGWCFMAAKSTFDEVGRFDERFNPAYCEDTDYWHRAWELGVELSPVPQARVTHARRTSAESASDWLLTSHRYLYGWKHGVEPMRAPPFYDREIVEYHCSESARSAMTT